MLVVQRSIRPIAYQLGIQQVLRVPCFFAPEQGAILLRNRGPRATGLRRQMPEVFVSHG